MNKNNKIKNVIKMILIVIVVFSIAYLGFNIFRNNVNKTESGIIDEIEIYEEIDIYENIEEEKENERILKLQKLQEINSDIKAYIEIEGTNISYPVLQTTDNDYYMYRNYKGEYSPDGSIFLDKNVDLNIPSTNFLMYGHNNENGNMFSELLKYKDIDYYRQHPTIKFVTNDEDAEYEVIAAFLSKVYYQTDKNVFRYYYFVNAGSENEFNNYVQNSINSSLYNTGKVPKYGEQLITLSTCSYHVEDGRFAVVARKVK